MSRRGARLAIGFALPVALGAAIGAWAWLREGGDAARFGVRGGASFDERDAGDANDATAASRELAARSRRDELDAIASEAAGPSRGAIEPQRARDAAPTVEPAAPIGPVVRARVVDASGRPRPGLLVDFASTPIEAKAPDAIATLTDVRELEKSSWAWSVAIHGYGFDPPRVRLDRHALPVEPIELVVPPSAALELRVVDEKGEPLALGGKARVERHVEIADDEEARARVWSPFDFTVPLDRCGTTRIAPVALGMDLQVAAAIDERDVCVSEPQPPLSDGETRVVTLRPVRRHLVVVGRLLLDDGGPLRAEKVAALAIGRAGGRAIVLDAEGTSDASGAFRLDLEHGGSVELDALDRVALRAPGRAGRPAAAVACGGPLPESRLVDVGAVTLRPAPRLAHGVVVDSDGRPIDGALVELQVGGAEPAKQRDGGERRAVPELASDLTNEDGRFELVGAFEVEPANGAVEATSRLPLVVIANGWHPRCTSEPQRVAAGDPELRLVAGSAGSIVGRVDLGGMPARFVACRFAPQEPWAMRDQEKPGEWSPKIGDDGRFELVEAVPGRWTFELRFQAFEFPGRVVASIDGIVVRGGIETRDPRLEPIELARLVPMAEVSVARRDGAPVVRADVLVHVEGGDLAPGARRSSDHWLALEGARWRLPVAAGAATRFDVRVPGCASASARTRGEPVELVVEPMRTTRLRLSESLAREARRDEAGGATLELRRRHDGAPAAGDALAEKPFENLDDLSSAEGAKYSALVDANGTLALELPGSGRYAARLWICLRRDDEGMETSTVISLQDVVVTDRDEEIFVEAQQ